MVGYTGGNASKPTYESVCAGDGHTEALQVKFDPKEVSYEDLVQKFFDSHSPHASKTQYKSGIWYADEEQKKIAEEMIAQQGKRAQQYTDLGPVKQWHNAEAYHQKYIAKKRGGYF
jgi:peptide-methionine (S)-S-oxide reductase